MVVVAVAPHPTSPLPLSLPFAIILSLTSFDRVTARSPSIPLITQPIHDMSTSSNMGTSSPKVETQTSPSSSSVKPEFYHALAVSNIRNNIPIMLHIEIDLYNTWAKVFRIHARSHRVLQHIVLLDNRFPPLVIDPNYAQWSTLDATVLHWMYSAIFDIFLTSIMELVIRAFTTKKQEN